MHYSLFWIPSYPRTLTTYAGSFGRSLMMPHPHAEPPTDYTIVYTTGMVSNV